MASSHGASVRPVTANLTPATDDTAAAVRVMTVDASGAYAAAGGGTQYTEGDTDATITGTAALAEGSGNTLKPLQVDASNSLQINIKSSDVALGGGVQYTEADVDTTITGTAVMWEDASDTLRAVSAAKPLPVGDAGGSLTVDGTVAATQSGTWNVGTVTSVTNVVHVDDNASSLTVDDGGGSLTVDGSVSVSGTVTVDSELTTADLDTGGGTDTRAVVGLIGSKSGGGQLIPGDATAGLKVDLGADNDVTVTSGTITTITNVVHVDDNASTLSVDDGGGSLTVDGTVAATQSGTWTVQPGNTANTTAWKVDASSVAVPVTDNSGSLTVDNAGTFAVQDSQVIADNAGFTDGTSKVFAAGFIYDEVAGTALTENDAAAARINVNRAQVATIEDGATRGRYATVSASNALKVDGSAVTQPVSGTVTANLAAGTNNIGDVDVLTVPAPLSTTGGGTEATALRVTVASDSTGVLSVDDNGGSLTVDNAGTFAVQATVAAAATNIAKAEDVASADADVGVPAMAVRKATPANTSGTDGDYEMLQMSAGRLWTSATIDTALPAGTNAIGKLAANSGVDIGDVDVTSVSGNVTVVQATASNLNAQAVGSVAHDGVDSGNPVKIGGKAITSLPAAVANLDRVDASFDEYGAQIVTQGPPREVTGTVASATTAFSLDVGRYSWVSIQLTGTWSATMVWEVSNDNSNWSTIYMAVPSVPNSGITGISSNNLMAGPILARYFRLRCSSYSSGTVSYAVQFFVNPQWAQWVQYTAGQLAHDAVDSGHPVKIGGRAITASPTAVAAADRTDVVADVYGRPFVRAGHQWVAGSIWTATHVPAANTQATATKASAGAGVRNVCTALTVSLVGGSSAPSASQVSVAVIDGASGGGTYLWRSVMSIPAVAGQSNHIVLTNLWLPGTAATAMTIEFSAAGGANTVESVWMSGTTVAE